MLYTELVDVGSYCIYIYWQGKTSSQILTGSGCQFGITHNSLFYDFVKRFLLTHATTLLNVIYTIYIYY